MRLIGIKRNEVNGEFNQTTLTVVTVGILCGDLKKGLDDIRKVFIIYDK